MKNELPQRKSIRLKNYDYSSNGYYFVTICADKKQNLFSTVTVYDNSKELDTYKDMVYADKIVSLSKIGLIVRNQLLSLEKRYESVKIDEYVIMPNHIHAIIIIENKTAGASPCPTLSDIICTYKSLTTIECNKIYNKHNRKIFQSSFYDKIISNEKSYLKVWEYINENPRKWENDEYYK